MGIKSGTYGFECFTMPWTDIDLGLDSDSIGNHSVEIIIELSQDDIQSLVSMMHWAWDNSWFEVSNSEIVCAQLLKKHNPQLYDTVYLQAHKQFCTKYHISENVNGFGVYEIFPHDEIVEYANKTYENTNPQPSID